MAPSECDSMIWKPLPVPHRPRIRGTHGECHQALGWSSGAAMSWLNRLLKLGRLLESKAYPTRLLCQQELGRHTPPNTLV